MARAMNVVVSLIAAASGATAKVTPLQKVQQMLYEMQTRILADGEAEAKDYQAVSCFCKTETARLSAEITDDQNLFATNKADLEAADSQRLAFQESIATANQQIRDNDAAAKQRKEQMKVELMEYEKNTEDMRDAVSALEGAIKELQASRLANLVQLRSVAKTVRTAISMADILGFSAAGKVAAFFQKAGEPFDVPTEDYKFHSDSIISTLQELLDQFTTQMHESDKDWDATRGLHEVALQTHADEKAALEKELARLQTEEADTMATMSDLNKQMSQHTRTIEANQALFMGTQADCLKKQDVYHQRVQMRVDETAALVKARVVIQGVEVGNAAASSRPVLLLTKQRVQTDASNIDGMLALEAAAEAADAAPSFLQKRQVFRHADPAREKVLNLLRAAADKVQNKDLSMLVSELPADPSVNGAGFIKVRTLIEELITRLQKEASHEQTQDSWCRSETDSANTLKSESKASISENTVKKEALTAEIEQFKLQTEQLTIEIGQSEAALENIRAQRHNESLANAETIKTTQAGLTALKVVNQELEQFYKAAAKATVSNRTSEGAYTAAQEDFVGVQGMLEVIKSDFERTISETESAEKAAKEAFVAAERGHLASSAQMAAAKDGVAKLQLDAEEHLADAEKALTLAETSLANAQAKLDSLVPVCVSNKVSDAERIQHLKDEVDALREAMDILRNYKNSQ